MEDVNRRIVLLLDDYSEESKKLHDSFRLAGSDCKVLLVNDDGFFPDGVESIYESFLGDFSEFDTYLGKPRYFNRVLIPEYWEIEASASGGEIRDLTRERAKMYFISTSDNKRRVKVVEWFGDNGKVRVSDHYNRYGVLYARTTFNSKGERVNKAYFNKDNREVIVENYVTGAIILNWNDREILFSNKTDFIVFYMKNKGYDKSRIYYNSLSYPFFVSERLASRTKDDILFWQEPKRDDIPGNMKIILDGQSSRTQMIIVQRRDAYEKLIELGVPATIVRQKGYIYSFERENKLRPNVLICTNSDQIERLEDIVNALPEVKFNIAAITNMSEKLIGMEKYPNVSLYPNVKNSVLDDLFLECDYYLDINRYDEICNAVYRAFLNNQVVFAFDETRHNTDFESDMSTYKIDDWQRMVSDIKETISDKNKTEQRLVAQKQKALSEDKRSYSLIC